jgi:hypothetical protein
MRLTSKTKPLYFPLNHGGERKKKIWRFSSRICYLKLKGRARVHGDDMINTIVRWLFMLYRE